MMDARLHSARRAVRAATRQAHAALVSSDAAVYGDPAFNEPANDQLQLGDDGGDDWSDRAGADLGVQLFGTSASYVAKLEEGFAARLTAVEGELDGVQAGLAALEHDDGGSPSRPERAPMDDEEVEEGGEVAAEDVPTLKRHIAFLRRCQAARKLLEDADRLSSSAHHATTGGASKGDSGGGSPGSVAFHSPTSLCGPGDFAKLAFEAGAPEGSGNGERPLVRAAGWVAEAERLVEEAGKGMMIDGRDGEDGGDGQARMRAEMLDQLTQSALRQRTELRHRAATVIQSCVVVEENGLLIRGSGTAGNAEKKKAVTFDIQESPIAASTPTNEGKTPPSPLGDAYQVLEALADPAFPSFGQTLDGAMRDLAGTIYEGALKPCWDALDEAATEQQGRVAYYKLTRETRKSVRAAGEATSVRGPAARLGWTLASAAWEGANAGNATIATAADVDEKALQTAPPNVSGFLASLNLLGNVLTFVHEHALLDRSDLAAMLGKHLLGTYPKVPSTLLRGEDTPLMGRLLQAMRKRCLPVESCPEAWKALREAAARLGAEAGAFERKMAEMGLMMEAPGGFPTEPTSSTAGAPTSPAGPSALADTPVRTHDATAVDGSAQNASPEVATDAAVLSPLSELARSLRRAYVESRRGAILDRGRAILLDTDYHNTVEVGVDAPDLSAPGALASLDDDLLSAAFALHRCAVSATAQRILDLARETLDAAAAADGDAEAASDRPEALRPALYRAARGLFDLFRALVPAAHAGEAGDDPRTAAVLHNDGAYLAHAALSLGAEYKGRFRRLESTSAATRLLGETCTFLDLVPPLRDLATKSMGRAIELQKGRLCELVAPRLANFRRALASNEAVAEWDDADAALRGALHHLRQLSQAWRHVLSRQIYNQAMGNLVDAVWTLYLDPVMKAEDISESASRFVHSLFLDGTSGMSEVFIASGDDAGDTADASLQAARKYSALFGRAEAVGQFMPMRLDEIERGCEEGVFSSVSAKELAHLILAAFDDVPKRAALLNNLATQP